MPKFYTPKKAVAELLSEGWTEELVYKALHELTGRHAYSSRLTSTKIGIGQVRAARALLREWTDNEDLRRAGLL